MDVHAFVNGRSFIMGLFKKSIFDHLFLSFSRAVLEQKMVQKYCIYVDKQKQLSSMPKVETLSCCVLIKLMEMPELEHEYGMYHSGLKMEHYVR